MTDHERDVQAAKETLDRLRIYDYRQDDNNVVMCLAYIHDGLMATEAILNEHAKLKRYVEEFHDEDFVMWCREQDALADTQEE